MSLGELFWAGQLVYITEVFRPIIIAFLILVPVLVILFAFGFFRRYRLWRLGQPEKRSERWLTRLTGTLAVAIANIRIVRRKELYPGLMHILIFAGAVALVLGKVVRPFSYLTGLTTPPQSVYLYASLISEIGGALILIGGAMAVYRRYIRKPSRLDTRPDDTLIFIWVFVIILTGFMAKGFRIASSEVSPADWPMWSPVGYLFSYIFPTFMTEAKNEILVWHRAIIHALPAFVFLAYICINRSRLQHILLSPLNVFFRSLQPKGTVNPIDFESSELFGASKIEHFTWKQLMDLDACTRCGRCQDACPAYFSGKKLNPKQVIQDLLKHLQEVYPVPLLRKPIEARKDMLTDVITEDVIWDCTTCRACQQACPVYIEHVDKIIEMRRNLAMERSQFPESVQEALKCLGTREHPFRGTTATRTDWAANLGIKVLAEDSKVDILYWVGCTAALDERNMKVAMATAKIMREAGINFGILGAEEACCGDPARRMGDEYLFQTLCQKNIEVLKGYNIGQIVTTCPHCFNTLKKEYKQFGGHFNVIHHTQFIADLIRDGKLPIGKLENRPLIAYHDSCYLGRYNDIYQPPRDILKAIGATQMVELARCRSNSFCCGGGGGHMWMEEKPDQRVNERRVDEIIRHKIDTVATACPYCLTMFEDGLKAREAIESIKAMDLSELVMKALGKYSGDNPQG